MSQSEGPHLRPHLGHREPTALSLPVGTPPQTSSTPLRPHPGHRECVCFAPLGRHPPHPHPFHRRPPLALPPWGTSHLELHHCPSNPIPVSEDPIAWIPRVRSHLKFHHCPSNPICVTEALTCHVPTRGPHLNAALVTEDSFALCLWWGSYDKPHPRHP